MDRATSTDPAGERRPPEEAARKRAAIELIKRHERALRRTAWRYSLCAEDAEDAYQRALEILLTKAPTDDWVQLIPSERAGPADIAERRELVARSREALQNLKPQELRALTLLAEGYSYREIGAITGWTRTKVNRCLAEGRARFRAIVSDSESGGRCEQLSATLSAFCDGEASAAEAASLREHLRACAHCRATLRAFRAAPPAAAALLPIAAAPTMLERAHAALSGLPARLPGRSGSADIAISQVAASGGMKGAGVALGAKMLAACLGTVGAAAIGVATGVLPAPAGSPGQVQQRAPHAARSGAGAEPEVPAAVAMRAAPRPVAAPRRAPQRKGPRRSQPIPWLGPPSPAPPAPPSRELSADHRGAGGGEELRANQPSRPGAGRTISGGRVPATVDARLGAESSDPAGPSPVSDTSTVQPIISTPEVGGAGGDP